MVPTILHLHFFIWQRSLSSDLQVRDNAIQAHIIGFKGVDSWKQEELRGL